MQGQQWFASQANPQESVEPIRWRIWNPRARSKMGVGNRNRESFRRDSLIVLTLLQHHRQALLTVAWLFQLSPCLVHQGWVGNHPLRERRTPFTGAYLPSGTQRHSWEGQGALPVEGSLCQQVSYRVSEEENVMAWERNLSTFEKKPMSLKKPGVGVILHL